MFETGEPYAREELLAALGQVEAAGLAAVASMSGAEFFESQGSAWSPAEHIRHLSKSARPVARALDIPRIVLALRFGLHRGPSPTFADLRERYLARLEAGATAGRFAPSAKSRPADVDAGREAILDEWAQANRALGNAFARWAERALDRYRLPHPVLGPLTLREMMAFTVYHTAHHLRRVVERRGVPAPPPRSAYWRRYNLTQIGAPARSHTAERQSLRIRYDWRCIVAMRMRPLAWFAATLAVLNIAATVYAAILGEPWHAAIHVGLTAAFGAWSKRLAQRPRPAATDETLEVELDGVRRELLETREDLDFAERMLAERLEAERLARRAKGD